MNMGTSTRKVLPRSNKIINEAISNGGLSLSNGGSGLANLIPKLMFPDKGQSKIKKVSNGIFRSQTYYNFIQKIVKTIKKVNSSGITGLGITGFSNYNRIQRIEILSDYLGIENDETLKQSFKDTLLEIDIFEENVNPIDFVIKYIQNIFKNILESFSFEDASQNIDNFDDNKTDVEFNEYITSNTDNVLHLHITDDFISNIDDNELTIKNLNKAYYDALQSLKG